MFRFTKILKLVHKAGLRQSEFVTFRSPEFTTIFTEGRSEKLFCYSNYLNIYQRF